MEQPYAECAENVLRDGSLFITRYVLNQENANTEII